MSQTSDNYLLSPRKSMRTPKKKRQSISPSPSSPTKRSRPHLEPEVMDEDIEAELLDAATTHDEIVLPGEEEEEKEEEEIYCSLPPDITIEQIVRVTRSAVQGETLRVTRNEDKSLKIISTTALMAASEADTNFHTRNTCQCVVCERTIETGEMFLNFPDDLDRRRIWGNLLGFRYQDMLRIKSRMLTVGAICTDHFAEECFRMYNFNKAAIEALGVPKHASPNKSPIKRKPWRCTICPFASYSPYRTYQHILKDHIDANDVRNTTDGTGYSCPFCRRCTYGYKTLSGFKRHMMCPPLEHCHLKRVYETARDMCRAATLEPANQWPTWNEENVSMGYYGFIPPKKVAGLKRPVTEPNSPAKPLLKITPRPDSASPAKVLLKPASGPSIRFIPSSALSSSSSSSTVLRLPPSVSQSTSTMTSGGGERRMTGMGLGQTGGQERQSGQSGTGTAVVTARPDSQKAILYTAMQHAPNSQTLADVLAGMNNVAGGIGREEALAEVVNEPLNPVYLKRWMSTTDIRVSKRQIEAAQARARLFGDALGPGDIPLPAAPSLRSESIRNSHQRLMHVERELSDDLSSRRPLFAPVTTVVGRPRINILRPKPSPHSQS